MAPRQTRTLLRLMAGLATIIGGFAATSEAPRARDFSGMIAVTPGMNQTELQSVLGPPGYIQVRGMRQAWQYCPRDRFLVELFDVVTNRPRDDLFITVWFRDGQVEHMRAYPGKSMGSCEDFYSAFRWEDIIDGGGDNFGVRIK